MVTLLLSNKISGKSRFFKRLALLLACACLLTLPAPAAKAITINKAQTSSIQADAPVTVYIFLSETCPISQYYTLALKVLYQEFKSEEIQFIGVFPNSYSTPETIAAFKKKYDLPFTLQSDPEQKLTKALGATITPEVIVKNTASGTVFYKGRIDDSYQRVGKRRTVVTAPDLKNALTDIVQKQPVRKPEAPAIGCYITFLP